MAISQNVSFSGEAALDSEFEHPPGASIARLLQDGLSRRGWDASDFDNWRDSGWSVVCQRVESKLELTVAKMTVGDLWLMQIAPSYTPGFVGSILKKHASATPDAIQALALDAFAVLLKNKTFTDFMWRWDGFPEVGNSTPEPVPAQ